MAECNERGTVIIPRIQMFWLLTIQTLARALTNMAQN
jgi:hypothetical protein